MVLQVNSKVIQVNKTSCQPSSIQPEWEEKGRGKKGRKGVGNKPKNLTVTKKEFSEVESCPFCDKDLSTQPTHDAKFRKILRDGERLQTQGEKLEKTVFKRRLSKLHTRLYKLLICDEPDEILKIIIKKVKLQGPRILTYVAHQNVPCHNNFGEYLIRIGVLKRKISSGSKSKKGAQAYAILLSFYVTCKLRDIPFLNYIKQSLIYKNRKPHDA